MTLLANVAAAVGVCGARPSLPACANAAGIRHELNELPHMQVSAADKNGHTPLHGAAEAGSAPCLQLLLEVRKNATKTLQKSLAARVIMPNRPWSLLMPVDVGQHSTTHCRFSEPTCPLSR